MPKDSLAQSIHTVRSEMARLLEGMDYCLDWKADEGEWSARQLLYHLIDTPPGGIHAAARGVLHGEVKALTITAGLTNLTPERQNTDLGQVQEEIEAILVGLEEVLASATEADLDAKSVSVHFPSRDATEGRSLRVLIERQMDHHWREHMGQLEALRESLGFG